MAEKLCRRCKTLKPTSSFSLSRREKDGFQQSCKSCAREMYLKRSEGKRGRRIWLTIEQKQKAAVLYSTTRTSASELAVLFGCSEGTMIHHLQKLGAKKFSPNSKVCSMCHQDLPLESFNRGTGYGGRHSLCRKCQSLRHRVTRYGLGIIPKLETRRCEICDGVLEKINVDHCHATGVVRGVLCSSCNWALGQAKDNPFVLRKMADYLEKVVQ